MKKSLFTISYAGLWGQHCLDLPGVVARAGRLGYEAVMIAGKRPHLSPLDESPEVLANLRQCLDSAGVECAVLAAYTDFSGAGAAEVPILEMQMTYVSQLARMAADLGAGTVRVFTAYENPGLPFATVWRRVVASLQECCDRAAEHGITLAVQNHHDIAVHSDAMLELLGDIDRANCKLGFDAWSPALRGEDLYDSARRMAPHTAITTNADYVRLPRFQYQPELINYAAGGPSFSRAVPFGEGGIDYEAFFKGLTDGGFDGVATFEMCSPLRGGGGEANLDRCARSYLKWMARHEF